MRRIFTLLLSLLLTGSGFRATANHLLGAEINYSLVSINGNQQVYKVTLSFFADCSSNVPGGAYVSLMGASPTIDLLKNGMQVSTLGLSYNAAKSNIEITPVCADEAGNTTCKDINNPLPGIKIFVYDGNFTLTDTSSNWRFAFNGAIGPGTNSTGMPTSAGRSFIIQNAQLTDPVTAGATVIYLEATLNNTTGPNNSPTFTSLPTPFFCLDKASTYTLGAADVENDQLRFSLIPGKSVSAAPPPPVNDVVYIPPFSGSNPLPTAPGNFNFNTTNGQMNFVPNQVMNCLVTNLVEEFRNGIKVGSSMREMTFVILNNCTNDAPTSPVSDIQHANIDLDTAGNLMLNVCEGQSDSISFVVVSVDPNGDNTNITYSNLPPGASISIENNGTINPRLRFTWSAIDAAPGNYLFYITYTDDGCPLVSTKTITYTITINEHPNKFKGGSSPSCNSSTSGQAWAIPDTGVTTSYTYRWVSSTGGTLRNVSSTSGDTLSNIAPGTYKVYIRNAEGCGKNVEVTVTEIPLPEVGLPGDTTLCIGLPLKIATTIPQSNVSYLWNTNDTTCCITINQPGIYTLKAINKCGSVKDEIQIDYVKCTYCLFVPNAFSPNGDGKNDKFNILETCLIEKYKLQVFNRWGQLVFTTLSTSNSWDGTYNGHEAEGGVYFYVIDAIPTDKSKGTIQLKGDITLIR